MIDFPYKVYNIKDYLNNSEVLELEGDIDKFDVSENNFKTMYTPLLWSNDLIDILKEKNPNFLNKIMSNNFYDYDDFKYLVELNKTILNYGELYSNFRLAPFVAKLDTNKFYKLYEKVFLKIIEDIFNRKQILKRSFLPHVVNTYPKGSFLRKHQDGEDVNNIRIFTMLFFVNKNWDINDGSLFRMYDENNKIIDIIPNYENVVVLNHLKYNYIHEVTENLSDKIRYSIFTPLSINDLENYFN